MKITVENKFADVFSLPEFEQMRGQFIASSKNWFTGGKEKFTFRQLNKEQETWNADDMVFGMNRLQQIAFSEKEYVFALEDGNPARLICMPSSHAVTDTFCLLLAGGAYGAVCSLAESIPVAARLNELGMDCFCLNYRTADENSMVHGLMPKPLDDTASALRFIKEKWHRERYCMAGFSAGGHAAAMWGTAHRGARQYGLPQPEMLLLDYPLISLMNIPKGVMHDFLLQGLFGAGYNRSLQMEYSAELHVDSDYPPVYLAKAKDDSTVPPKDAEDFSGALNAAGVKNVFEIGESGNHGYGLGTATALHGWVDRAVEWMKKEQLI